MINYSIKNNSILNISDNSYDFKFRIEEVITFTDYLVVMLYPRNEGNKVPPDDNVFGIDKNCQVIWQIKRPIHDDRYPSNPIISVKKIDEKTVECHDWVGAWWKVDVATGVVTFIEWVKM